MFCNSGSGNCWWIIILLLLLSCGCGGNFCGGNLCGSNENSCGCGC